MQTQPGYYWGNHEWHIYNTWNPLTLSKTLTFHSENNSHDLTPLYKHPNSQIIDRNLNSSVEVYPPAADDLAINAAAVVQVDG